MSLADPAPEATTRGRPITRDKTHLGSGDDIQAVMRRFGAGDRIFVFLSETDLRSPACMSELSEVWRTSRREEQAFTDRVRFFTVADVRIWTTEDRTRRATHWTMLHDDVAAPERAPGHAVLGASGLRDLRRMQGFYQDTADVLDRAGQPPGAPQRRGCPGLWLRRSAVLPRSAADLSLGPLAYPIHTS